MMLGRFGRVRRRYHRFASLEMVVDLLARILWIMAMLREE